MKLGIPKGVDSTLARRLAWLTPLRLLVLGVLLVIVETYYLRQLSFGGFSTQVGLTAVGVAFFLSAAYGLLLRKGRWLERLAYAQIFTDQLTWTAIAYISGGVTSGSSSLYGLTCVTGAVLVGTRGAAWAAATGMLSYLTMCLGFAYRWLPTPPDQPPDAYVIDPQQMVYPAFSTLVGTALVAILAAYLSERLRTFGGRLEAATRRAEEAERLASLGRLAAALAHEIRNPLGSIRGSIELLRTGEALNDEDKRLCEIIEREAARLNDLVTDMVDLSRPREPSRQPVDLAFLSHGVVELARRSSRGDDVVVRYDGPAALEVMADAGQMRQVLWNLVRNAVQASVEGSEVVVKLSLLDDGDALMSVTDTGGGIPESQREHIFDAYYSTRSHGVGIGLAVVKQVSDSHHYQLSVDTERERGTTFSLRIPRTQVLTAAVSLLWLVGCGGQEWLSEGTPDAIWWGDDLPASATSTATASTGEPARSASPSAAEPSPSASAIEISGEAAQGAQVFRNTYYDFPQEGSGGPSQPLFDASCQPIKTVTTTFHDQVCVQGSGRLATGQTVSFARRDCECAAECPRTGQRICFDVLDPQRFPHGRGASGTPITPLRSVAVDTDVIPLGTVLYIPAYHGLRGPDGQPHDGCFLAEDRGLKVKGQHVDIFTGAPATTRMWNQAVPSNDGVTVIVGASRCDYLVKR